MSSKEEYLDGLLKSMNGEETKASEDTAMTAEEIEAMFAAAEKVALGDDSEEEVQESVQVSSESENLPAEPDQESGEPVDEFAMPMEEDKTEDTLEQVADAFDSAVSHTVESTKMMSQEEIEQLLLASAENKGDLGEEDTAQAFMSENAQEEELIALLGSLQEDTDLNEISDLLEKSANNEAVDENVFNLLNEEDAVDIVDIDNIENIEDSEKEDGKKKRRKKLREKKPKVKRADKNKDIDVNNAAETDIDAEAEIAPLEGEDAIEEKIKKKGFFVKLFSTLTQEVAEEAVLDENLSIMQELEEEDREAARRKKKIKKGNMPVKGRRGEEDKDDGEDARRGSRAVKKPSKPVKPKKVRKIKEPVIDEKPPKKISKKSIFVVMLFATTVFAAILFLGIFLSNFIRMQSAKAAFAKQDYMTCYEEMYGLNLSEEENEIFKHSEIVLKLQRRLDIYQKYIKEDNELYALDSLMQAVAGYDEMYAKAQKYGAATEVAALYNLILQILEDNYGLTQDVARAIALCESDVDYTRYLTALTEGSSVTEEGGGGSITLPSEGMPDVLPAEEELTQPNFVDQEDNS